MPSRHFNVTSALLAPPPSARRAAWRMAACCVLALGLTTTARAFEPVPKLPADPLTLASSTIATAAAPAWGPVQIVVYKAKRSLALYRFGNFYREYPVVLGLKPDGRKRYANDARTPEGLYHVVQKRAHERWQYFLDLDYPNAGDRKLYEEEKSAGRIPDEDGSPFRIGGSIGIHGNDRADQQAARVDWTKGCVAMDPADIAEIEALTPVGTPVWIVQ